MPLIEGVGDEVVQFVGVVLVVVVAALAWWSTNARPDRYRTVLVMRSRAHPVTVSIRTRPNMMVTSAQGNSTPTSESVVASTSNNQEETRETARVIPLQEMDSIVDADMAMLDNNRLHFYRRIDTSSTPVTESASEDSDGPDEREPASTEQIREMESIVSAMEDDVINSCNFLPADADSPNIVADTNVKNEENKKDNGASASNGNNTGQGTSDSGDSNAKKILIKLKYLNDTLKEVEGSLDELLKDFKWRHFSSELSRECRVRLIFNGRVLADEAATLRALGLHHRAVVHALVHPKRQNNQPTGGEEGGVGAAPELSERGAGAGAGGGGAGGAAAGGERSWDLENIFMTLVSVALTVVWFFRCEYSNMFTASASVALFGLTVFYSVAIFGLYLSDTFHIDRRPHQPQAVPNN